MAVSLEDAIKIAKEVKPNIDYCLEYSNGYYFSSSEDEGYIGGHGHSPVVVVKATGKITTMPEFVADGPGKEIKEYDI